MPPPFDRLLSADYLFSPEPGAPSLIYAIIGIAYLIVLLLSAVGYRQLGKIGPTLPPGLQFLRKVSIAGMAVGILGVVLVSARYLVVPILSARILIYALVVATLALLAYLIYYIRSVYPSRRAKLQAEALQRRYMDVNKSRRSAPTRIVKHQKKGKRRR